MRTNIIFKVAFVIVTALILIISCREAKAHTARADANCDTCYFHDQAYSDGGVASYGALNFKCSAGKWYRVGGMDPVPGQPGNCVPCVWQNMKYSEGAWNSMNSINNYRCISGQWQRINP